jgi:hypothetical protein
MPLGSYSCPGVNAKGTQSWFSLRSAGPFPSTPTTMYGLPSMRTARPTSFEVGD